MSAITPRPTGNQVRFADTAVAYDAYLLPVAPVPRSFECWQPSGFYEFGQVTYDDELNPSTVTGLNGTEYVYTRDAAGRVTETTNRLGSIGPSLPGTNFNSYMQTYAYRPDGRIASMESVDGASVLNDTAAPNHTVTLGVHSFTYDTRGHVATRTSFEGTYTYGYDELGRNTLIEYPDGHERVQQYDHLGRLTSRCYVYANGSAADRCSTAQYDPVGNPLRLTDPEGADVFEYDALDRLKTVTREVSGATVAVEQYAYNALGALSVHAGAAVDHQRPRLDGIGSADAAVPASLGGQAVNLDAGGRVTSLRANTFEWSTTGQLRAAGGVRTGHDVYGRRVFNGAQFYLYEGDNRIAQLEASNGVIPPGRIRTTFIYDGIDHPLRIATTSLVNEAAGDPPPPPIWRQQPVLLAYYEVDLAGNVRRLRAPGGQDLGGYRYTAFGRTLENTVTNENATNEGHFDLKGQPLRWKGRP